MEMIWKPFFNTNCGCSVGFEHVIFDVDSYNFDVP